MSAPLPGASALKEGKPLMDDTQCAVHSLCVRAAEAHREPYARGGVFEGGMPTPMARSQSDSMLRKIGAASQNTAALTVVEPADKVALPRETCETLIQQYTVLLDHKLDVLFPPTFVPEWDPNAPPSSASSLAAVVAAVAAVAAAAPDLKEAKARMLAAPLESPERAELEKEYAAKKAVLRAAREEVEVAEAAMSRSGIGGSRSGSRSGGGRSASGPLVGQGRGGGGSGSDSGSNQSGSMFADNQRGDERGNGGSGGLSGASSNWGSASASASASPSVAASVAASGGGWRGTSPLGCTEEGGDGERDETDVFADDSSSDEDVAGETAEGSWTRSAVEAEVLLRRATLYTAIEAHELALIDATRSVELNPRYPAAYYRMGHSLFKTGQSQGAAEAFRQGLEQCPGSRQLRDAFNVAIRAKG